MHGRSRRSAAAVHAFTGTLEMMGALMSFSRNEEIYREAEAAEYLYKVVSGAVRMYKVLADGRRQIGAFYLPGDMFGFEPEDAHASSAEAIGDVTVLVFKRSAVLSLAAGDNDVARWLWEMTAREQACLAVDFERAGAGGLFPAGNGRPQPDRERDRAADVAPGHRGLSGTDDRNRVAHAVAAGKRRRDRSAGGATDHILQLRHAQSSQRLLKCSGGLVARCYVAAKREAVH
jgi:hypothetical protein